MGSTRACDALSRTQFMQALLPFPSQFHKRTCAWSDTPTVATSPSTLVHSWLLAYFKPSITVWEREGGRASQAHLESGMLIHAMPPSRVLTGGEGTGSSALQHHRGCPLLLELGTQTQAAGKFGAHVSQGHDGGAVCVCEIEPRKNE